MSRRGFIKWLLAAVALLAGGLWQWLRPRSGADSVMEATSVIPTPESPPTPSPTASQQPVREQGKLLLSFFLLSDLHITVGEQVISGKLRTALKDITTMSDKAEAIVLGGDLTDFGRESDYKQLRGILNEFKLPPVYGNMGNHDYYNIWLDKDGQFSQETMPNGKTDAESRKRFQEFMGFDKPYHDVKINGVHLIMVSQEAYVQERDDVGEGAWYSDEQLEWLKKTLEPHHDGSPALVFIHQPLPPVGSDGGSHRLIRANEFRAILKPYPNVFVFSGHTHRDFNTDNHYSKETFHWFTNSTVGRLRTGNRSQGMHIQVYEGTVVVRGREFSEQSWIGAANWKIPLV